MSEVGGCSVLVLDGPPENVVVGPLLPRNDLRNHSPDGFEWGYGGSGPAQLALALLADATGFDRVALQYYQEYKARVVAGLDHKGWTLTQEQVLSELSTYSPDAYADVKAARLRFGLWKETA